jgi:hypothetical protein
MKSNVLIFTLVAGLSTAANAATGPEIAYSVRGSRPAIYVVNPDGSGKRLSDQGASKTFISGLSIRPGGGEISFEEVGASGQTGQLKTVQYGESGTGTVIRTVSGCRFQVDYRPVAADGTLFYVDSCSRTIQYVSGGTTSPINVGQPVAKIAWLKDGESFLFSARHVTHAPLDAPFNQTVIAPDLQCVQWMNSAKLHDEALIKIGDACGGGIGRLTVSPASWTPGIEQGDAPSYSTDDLCFVYITPYTRSGSYLMIRRVDGASQPVRIGARANYADVTWRRLGSGETGSPCPVAAPPQ